MLIVTFIPQITFAVEDVIDMAESEEITSEEPAEETPEVTEEPSEEATDESFEYEVSGVITGFVPLETTEYYYEGNPDEGDLTVYLPETLSVYLDGSDQPSNIAVSWEAVEDFDDTDFYFYSLKPVWGEGITLSSSLSEAVDVPWITVYKQEPENTNVEPVVTEEEAEPIYTEEEGSIDPEEGAAEETSGTSLKAFALDNAGEIVDNITEDSYADTAANTATIYNYLTGTMGGTKYSMVCRTFISGVFSFNICQTFKTFMLGCDFLIYADRPFHVFLGPEKRANHIIFLVFVQVKIASFIWELQYISKIRIDNPNIRCQCYVMNVW